MIIEWEGELTWENKGAPILMKEETKNLKFSKKTRLEELYALILCLSLIGMLDIVWLCLNLFNFV